MPTQRARLHYTEYSSFRAIVEIMADRSSIYTIPDSFRAIVEIIADRPSIYTIPDVGLLF